MISPFLLNKNNINCRNVLVAFMIGIIQILHFVHILSLIFKFQFINNFYDIIGGENLLKPFMSDKYKAFINETKEIEDNIDIVIKPDEIISKDSRISFLKIIIFVISSLSYVNSNITPFINLIKDKDLDFKMLTYGIFNPGAGIFVSGILFFNGEYCKIIISLIGVLFGIILMFCPYLLGIGLYLVKIIKHILNLFLVKIITIYFGIVGMIFSLIYSILQNDLNKNNSKKTKEIFDINFEICSYSCEKKSNFGIVTIIRIIFNLVIPGSGIFSLLCNFGCHIGIFFIGLFQMISGLLLALIIYII